MEYTLFVDESYGSDHYYIAGVLTSELELLDLNKRFSKLASLYQERNNLAHTPEFHGHFIMTGRDDWFALEANFGSAIALLNKLTVAISQSGSTIFVEGVDTKKLNKRYKYPNHPHEICFRHLLERVNEYLIKNGAIGTACKVVADTVPDQSSYQEQVNDYCRLATPGWRSQKLVCIDPLIDFVDSREHFGVIGQNVVL